MTLYCGIDLHSNNSVVAVLDEQDRAVYEKRLPNDLETITEALCIYPIFIYMIQCFSTARYAHRCVVAGRPACRGFEHQHRVRCRARLLTAVDDDRSGAHQFIDRAIDDRADDAAVDGFAETRLTAHLERNAVILQCLHRGQCQRIGCTQLALRIDIALADQVVLVQVDAG